MIVAIVSPSAAAQDAYIHKVMAASSRCYRFSVQGRKACDREGVLLEALRRDASNSSLTTLVPVTTQEEVSAIRLMGGFVGHVYGLAHPQIRIEKTDFILANPAAVKLQAGHIPPHELCSELRTSLLAQRDRIGRA
ncbi:hypothetical protein [Aeromonas sp. QDB25]|uniref:hypothetical protein n=1 Tax=Aeromonas sp. QDB25 TaxID=2989832 RepID=UPI0022E89F8F|nr:hypothetical protein [Aeromonas sp. QDB25]